jgi:hypothetical protein
VFVRSTTLNSLPVKRSKWGDRFLQNIHRIFLYIKWARIMEVCMCGNTHTHKHTHCNRTATFWKKKWSSYSSRKREARSKSVVWDNSYHLRTINERILYEWLIFLLRNVNILSTQNMLIKLTQLQPTSGIRVLLMKLLQAQLVKKNFNCVCLTHSHEHAMVDISAIQSTCT